jgi:hypothetical protein
MAKAFYTIRAPLNNVGARFLCFVDQTIIEIITILQPHIWEKHE